MAKVKGWNPKYRDIPWSKWVLKARERQARDIERSLRDKDFPYYYDHEESQRAVDFFEMLRHFDGEWNGDPFILSDWQEWDIVRPIFGWRRKSDGLRRFRSGYIEVARKNGKSPLASGIAGYGLIADREPGAQVYCAATKESQARIVWDYCRKMLKASPELRDECEYFKGSIFNETLGSKFQPLGRDSDTQDGFSVHMGIVDEYHAHKTSEMLDVLWSGTGARRQPLILIITTAGHNLESPCLEEHRKIKRILDGELENDEIFGFIASVDDPEKWQDEAEWIKANPNWGISVKIENFRSDFRATEGAPTKQHEFQVKRLNIWKEGVNKWIKKEKWQALDHSPLDLEFLKGRRCFGGLDLGISKDISALVLAFYTKDPELGEAGSNKSYPEITILTRYWIPRETVRQRYLDDGVNYPAWVDAGWITPTDGPTTRHDIIRRDIQELASIYDIQEIALDQAHASQLMTELSDDGLTIIKHPQSMMAMTAPYRHFEELILSGRLKAGGDPVMGWMINNAVIVTDGNHNMKIMKNKSHEKVDGVVAGAMAIGRLMVAPEPVGLVYNDNPSVLFV